ncbi:PREDICTED: putative mediator of RNA polymerase II transcription subunit 26 [Prunus mume]|uniref:Mediator of RNA polymerase II transcription subunit 26 n=1 Tax=Prunus mume TaxID=102107 RepID=A0ABM1LVZ2_PRUMU|nr:PREDICTED: putative mediator of RNA polymerase II transcription subunit 26 [Prunus mume]
MADDHNEDPPNEVPAAVPNVEHAEDAERELQRQEEILSNQQMREYLRSVFQETRVEAIAPQEQPQQVAAPENEDFAALFQEMEPQQENEDFAALLQEMEPQQENEDFAALFQEMEPQQENEYFAALFQEIEPQQVAAPEQLLEQGSSSGINPCYQQSVQGLQEFGQFQETGVAAPKQLEQGSSSGINPSYYPQSVQGVQEFGQFQETEVAAPAQLAQSSSSGINKYVPSYPQEFAQLQERGTQHAQEIIAAQGMAEQQEELEQSWSLQVSPQFHEPAAQEHAVMALAAQDMPLPQQPQQVEQGGHAPPEVPPSLQNKITRCSKRFEKQLAYSDVTRTTLYMYKKDVESHILPLLEADEFRKRGIQSQKVTVYDIDGDEYPMLFKRCGYEFLLHNAD